MNGHRFLGLRRRGVFPALLLSAAAAAQSPSVDRKLGATVPLDLAFVNEDGNEVKLRELVDRPVVLSLVYYRCPGACSPFLRGLARAVDLCDLRPGADYRLVTISFDPRETPQLAGNAKTSLLADMENPIPPESWSFLTGDQESIGKICDAVGFSVIEDKEDFLHPLTLTFLSPRGKVTRYLNVTEADNSIKILPADLKMAVMDASEGRVGSFMQKVQRLCFGFDTDAQRYVVKIDRILLAVTLLFVAAFGLFLLLRRKGPGAAGAGRPGGTSP